MKRYAVFAYDSYYPAGGWEDLIGQAETLEEARALRPPERDNWQIVDLEAGAVLEEGSGYELQPCHGLGHDWAEWRPVKQPKRLEDMPLNAFDLHTPILKQPTKERTCRRCGAHNDDGEYFPILPTLTPLGNAIVRVSPSDLGLESR